MDKMKTIDKINQLKVLYFNTLFNGYLSESLRRKELSIIKKKIMEYYDKIGIKVDIKNEVYQL